MSTAIRRATKPGASRWDVGVRSFAMSSILARHRLRTCARASGGGGTPNSPRAGFYLLPLLHSAGLGFFFVNALGAFSPSPPLSRLGILISYEPKPAPGAP